MLTILVNRPCLGVSTLATVDEARQALADPEALLWVDFDGRSSESDAILSQVFGFHPLAIEDVYKTGHNPKVEDYGRYLYVVVQALQTTAVVDVAGTETSEVDLFVGANFVVSHHSGPLAAIEAVRAPTLCGGKNHMGRGAAFLAHALLDAIIDPYTPLAAAFEQAIDDVEVRVLRGGRDTHLERILALIRSLHHLRRMAFRQRDMLQRLATTPAGLLPPEVRPFLRDVHEHFADFTETLDVIRDDVASIFNAAHSLDTQRMNVVIRVLTLISTIMLPLSFIAALYGMNFDNMPELRWRGGYALVLVAMSAVGAGMLVTFKRRRWI